MNELRVRKLVILAQPRTGSTLLQQLLDSQSSVHCDGELLTPDWGYLRSKFWVRFWSSFPLPYFEWRRFRRASGRVYGFKLMDFNLLPKRAKALGRHLHLWGWKVVHLSREDVLSQCFSNLLARKSGLFHSEIGDGEREESFRLDGQELLQELDAREFYRRLELEVLDSVESISLNYESHLSKAEYWPNTMVQICDFIGLESEPPRAKASRSFDRPVTQVVENYEELLSVVASSSHRDLLRKHVPA